MQVRLEKGLEPVEIIAATISYTAQQPYVTENLTGRGGQSKNMSKQDLPRYNIIYLLASLCFCFP
jgi:hypothetical protein